MYIIAGLSDILIEYINEYYCEDVIEIINAQKSINHKSTFIDSTIEHIHLIYCLKFIWILCRAQGALPNAYKNILIMFVYHRDINIFILYKWRF